jgi:peptidoglycan/LPS O-acetylase OafA/YrhL
MTAHAHPREPAARASHLGLLDICKGIAAQLIVLHHLAFYGPMADHARPLAPGLIGWLGDEARMAVQIFLVIGGFLAAKSLCPAGLPPQQGLGRGILRRYLKLAPPFIVAILIAVGASAWAFAWMRHPSISAPPQLPQLAAHALLLQSVLGYESLSAGAWYVAIDFQLFALASLLLAAARSLFLRRLCARPALPLVGGLMALSLFCFNRDPAWDAWGWYFFGSYGLGMMAWWCSQARCAPERNRLLAALLLLGAGALALDFRGRIALSLVTALTLALSGGRIRVDERRWQPLLRPLYAAGRISYSVFLVHFPVSLVVNAAFTRFAAHDPLTQAAGMVCAWLASLAAGAMFHRYVEAPLSALFSRAWPPRKAARRSPEPVLRRREEFP